MKVAVAIALTLLACRGETSKRKASTDATEPSPIVAKPAILQEFHATQNTVAVTMAPLGDSLIVLGVSGGLLRDQYGDAINDSLTVTSLRRADGFVNWQRTFVPKEKRIWPVAPYDLLVTDEHLWIAFAGELKEHPAPRPNPGLEAPPSALLRLSLEGRDGELLLLPGREGSTSALASVGDDLIVGETSGEAAADCDGYAAHLLRIRSDGSLVWRSCLHSSSQPVDSGFSKIAVRPDGSVVACGTMADGRAGFGKLEGPPRKRQSVFIGEWSPAGEPRWLYSPDSTDDLDCHDLVLAGDIVLVALDGLLDQGRVLALRDGAVVWLTWFADLFHARTSRGPMTLAVDGDEVLVGGAVEKVGRLVRLKIADGTQVGPLISLPSPSTSYFYVPIKFYLADRLYILATSNGDRAWVLALPRHP